MARPGGFLKSNASARPSPISFRGIVYLADAVGTQTETLAIRGLSVGVGIGRVARREAATALLVGLTCCTGLGTTQRSGRGHWPPSYRTCCPSCST